MRDIVRDYLTRPDALWHGKEKEELDSLPVGKRIRLADFIHRNTEAIVTEWETFARTLKPASNDMTPLALRDHIHQILAFIVLDIKSAQTRSEQVEKSRGNKEKKPGPTAAETHAALRLAGGFDIDQMVSEYRALRASVIKLWSIPNTEMNKIDVIDLTRFNEAIDQVLAESVSHYTKKVSYSKDLFMGILSHDLRNPLNAVSMSAQLMLNIGGAKEQQKLTEKQTMLTLQIVDSSNRITHIIDDLLDVTRARFGSGLPVIKASMDMSFVAKQLVDEMRAANPTRTIILGLSGDGKGKWDKARIGQVFSNLIGNAIQYSFKDSSIGVTIKGNKDEVLLSVHNEGVPIPSKKIDRLFDSFTRGGAEEGDYPGAISLGLGLYITKDIVVSHGGMMEVTSSEEKGTTFTARFPR